MLFHLFFRGLDQGKLATVGLLNTELACLVTFFNAVPFFRGVGLPQLFTDIVDRDRVVEVALYRLHADLPLIFVPAFYVSPNPPIEA